MESCTVHGVGELEGLVVVALLLVPPGQSGQGSCDLTHHGQVRNLQFQSLAVVELEVALLLASGADDDGTQSIDRAQYRHGVGTGLELAGHAIKQRHLSRGKGIPSSGEFAVVVGRIGSGDG